METTTTRTPRPELYHHPEAVSLLNAIRENDHDDAMRLIFADWLDENAGYDNELFDHYAARAEFIRVACKDVGKTLARQSREESAWLKTNWKLLFPTLVRMNERIDDSFDYVFGSSITGRRLSLIVFADSFYPYRIKLDVRRGFVFDCSANGRMYPRRSWLSMTPIVYADGPVLTNNARPNGKLWHQYGQHEDGTHWVRLAVFANFWLKHVRKFLRPTVDGTEGYFDQIGHQPSITYMDNRSVEHLRSLIREDINRAVREWAASVDPVANELAVRHKEESEL